MTAFELENVSFSYEGNPILRNVSARVEPGTFLCVVGPSGSGKTTLLRLLAGLEQPTGGKVTMGGKTLSEPDRDRAVVFQHDPLFPWITVEKNVAFAIQCTQAVDKKTALRQARQMLQQVELAGEGKKYPCQLSGGMKQRAALARALSVDSNILLLDEPFGALDLKTRQNMRELVESLWIKRGMTVVLVTHDPAEAVSLADRIWLIRNGNLEADMVLKQPRWERDTVALENDLKERFFQKGEELV